MVLFVCIKKNLCIFIKYYIAERQDHKECESKEHINQLPKYIKTFFVRFYFLPQKKKFMFKFCLKNFKYMNIRCEKACGHIRESDCQLNL